MTLLFEPNEFTVHELFYYYKGAYRTQVNGSPFHYYHIANWIRRKQIPIFYGGHKILRVERSPSFGNHQVVTLDGLTRDVLDDTRLYMRVV